MNFTNIFSTGTADCVQFEQQSPHLIANQNGKAEINCKHDDSSLVVMLWYRQQRTGTSLDLIGYGYSGSSPNSEPGFTERFTQTRQDTVKGSLTISNSLRQTQLFIIVLLVHSAAKSIITNRKTLYLFLRCFFSQFYVTVKD